MKFLEITSGNPMSGSVRLSEAAAAVVREVSPGPEWGPVSLANAREGKVTKVTFQAGWGSPTQEVELLAPLFVLPFPGWGWFNATTDLDVGREDTSVVLVSEVAEAVTGFRDQLNALIEG
jgi:hypothetical protein